MNWPKPAVTAVLFDEEGRVLLTRRSRKVLCPGTWCLPGGHLDGGNGWLESLEKEVWEEVGLRVKSHRLLGIYSDPRYHMLEHGGEKHYFVTAVFSVPSYEGTVRLNEESDESGWFSQANLPHPLLKSEIPKLEDAFSGQQGPFLR